MQRQASTALAVSSDSPTTVATPPLYEFGSNLVMVSRPHDAPAESIRALRTHLMAQHIDEGRRGLAVCAPSRGAGCTFVATNLAVALSQIGIKTLLIDANMRDPGVDKFIRRGRPGPGLQQSLAADDDGLTDNMEHEVLPNFSVLFAGGVAPNPQELLAGDRFSRLMNSCMRDFEATIIDTPPANNCSDARRVSTVLGYSIVVAKSQLSRVSDLRVLVSQLEGDHSRVIGTVLNEA